MPAFARALRFLWKQMRAFNTFTSSLNQYQKSKVKSSVYKDATDKTQNDTTRSPAITTGRAFSAGIGDIVGATITGTYSIIGAVIAPVGVCRATGVPRIKRTSFTYPPSLELPDYYFSVSILQKKNLVLCEYVNSAQNCEHSTSFIFRLGFKWLIKATTHTHKPIREVDKENTNDVAVFRTDKGSIKRAWCRCKNFFNSSFFLCPVLFCYPRILSSGLTLPSLQLPPRQNRRDLGCASSEEPL